MVPIPYADRGIVARRRRSDPGGQDPLSRLLELLRLPDPQPNGSAALKGYAPLVSAQHLYNLIRRDIEREILPACDAEGVGMICWSPLAAGMLTGKYRAKDKPDENTRASASRPRSRCPATGSTMR